MRAIIVDDEIDAIEVLESILDDFKFEIEIIDKVQSVKEAIQKIDLLQPDLVFLDVEMPNGNGFTVLEEVSFKNFQVIFITAFSQFAIKALRINALDYILKPIDPEDLSNAIEKARIKHDSRHYKEFNTPTKGQEKKVTNKIGVPTGNGIRYIDLDSIIRFQASGNYVYVHINNEKELLLSKTLKVLDKTLEGSNFIRVHQSHLVNIKHIMEFNRAHGSYLLLSNGDKITVSKAHRAAINNLFKTL